MKRVHLAVAVTLLLVGTWVAALLPAGPFRTWSGVVDRADAQGGFSKEQKRILKGKQKKMGKRKNKNMKGKMWGKAKWKMKQKMKGKKKNWG